MSRSYKTLRDSMSPESRARAEIKAKALIHELRLADLREAINKTQSEVAIEMGVSQAAVSQIESGKGFSLATLAGYVRAMGAELIISARYEDEDVRLPLENLIPRQMRKIGSH